MVKRNSRGQPKRRIRNQRITPFLTYNDRAEEAVKFYVSIFKHSKILNMQKMGEGGPIPAGKVLNATFELEGQRFMALDGGPYFSFAQGISLFVDCTTQAEVDHLYEKLSAGGEKQPCGWLKDKFGVSWQIIPRALGEMISDPKHGNAQAVVEAMLKMGKIDIEALEKAYAKR